MVKKIFAAVFVVLFLFLPCVDVFAADVNSTLNLVDIDYIQRESEELLEDFEQYDFSFKDTVSGFLKGEVDFSISGILNGVLRIFFGEITDLINLVGKIVVISVLSAVLKNLTTSFHNKDVGELGFYVCYIVLISIVMVSFREISGYVIKTVDKLAQTMGIMIPVFAGLVISSGNVARGTLMSGFILGSAQVLVTIIKYFFVPAITAVGVLTMVNNISQKGVLTQMIIFMRSLITYGIRAVAVIFGAVLSLQRLGTAEVGIMAGKTAKAVIGTMPVVGDAMDGAVETAVYMFSTLKNGIAATSVIFLILIAVVPVMKIFAASVIYKAAAALCEPVSDSRLIKTLSGMGDYAMLLLSTLFTVEFMFIFSVILLLTST